MIVFFGLMVTGLGQIQRPISGLGVIADSLSALGVGLFYMAINITYLAAWWIESTREETTSLAVIDFGPTSGWVIAFPLGIVIGLAFVTVMKFGLGSFFAFETLAIFGVNIAPIILFLAPILAIPIVEELFFGGLMTPTIAESLGIIPAMVIVGMIWILWHLGTYSSSVDILIALFAFRAVTTLVILAFDSLIPSIVAHIIINVAGTLLII